VCLRPPHVERGGCFVCLRVIDNLKFHPTRLTRDAFFLCNINHQQYFTYEQISVSAQKKESGELSILLQEFGLAPHYLLWMEYYAYHLAHPGLSQLELSFDLNVGHSTIQRALAFMKQELV